ncbi:MAG TPA: DUF4845 domain-containing protein [Steroidobacteraceae bacterium]|jgi:hypothetical protein|nr:DUF4845 domain-containing protein [Steroidobacteraceae bacterium]
MRKHQRGVTAIGWLFLLIPVAICVYAGIRIGPLYLNYFSVVHNLNLIAGEIDNGSANAATIRASIERHFTTDYIDYPSVKDLQITRDNGNWKIEANYDDQAPLFANVAILVTFDKTVKLKGALGD